MNWIDPTLGYPSRILIEGVADIPHRYVAITGQASHKSIPAMEVIHMDELDRVDGRDWEVFGVNRRGIVDGHNLYWGMFLLGIGAINVMVPAEQMRELTEDEKGRLRSQKLVMVGSHTGNVSYTVPTPNY